MLYTRKLNFRDADSKGCVPAEGFVTIPGRTDCSEQALPSVGGPIP